MTIKTDDAALIEFHSADNQITLSVRMDSQDETVWLNLNQISQLFQRDKSVISRHLKKIFETNELDRSSVVAFFATTASDNKTYQVEFFNLDAILSVGYRVNSKKGSEFRRWSSKVLKDHLIKGFSLNNECLLTSGTGNLTRSLDLLKDSLLAHGHITDIGSAAYERAAHLFYFTIKDHPFTDGNKRIGSFLLLLYLSSYGIDVSLSNEALVALALFVAQSQPSDKEIMIKLLLNLIAKEETC